MNEASLTTLWRFVRSDLAVRDFEAWVYKQVNLEDALGSALHFEVISADYRKPDNVFDIREKLRAALRPALKCECPTLPDVAAVPMGGDGLDQRFFATMRQVRSYGHDLWWLSLSGCRVCGQNWMVAQEERIYDDYMLKRLSGGQVDDIVNNNQWPSDFLTYVRVLEIGKQLSRTCRFIDPMSPSLVNSVRDLKRDRSNITATEIADLLGIDDGHATELIKVI